MFTRAGRLCLLFAEMLRVEVPSPTSGSHAVLFALRSDCTELGSLVALFRSKALLALGDPLCRVKVEMSDSEGVATLQSALTRVGVDVVVLDEDAGAHVQLFVSLDTKVGFLMRVWVVVHVSC